MATDRLTLARAFSDSGMERDKAEAIATAIFDAIHDNTITRADLGIPEYGMKEDLRAAFYNALRHGRPP